MTVSSTIIDENGQALPYVNVWVEETGIGTQADENGFFSIEVPQYGILNFSFMDQVTSLPALSIGDSVKIDSTNTLDEVYITSNSKSKLKYLGYGVLAFVLLAALLKSKTVKATI